MVYLLNFTTMFMRNLIRKIAERYALIKDIHINNIEINIKNNNIPRIENFIDNGVEGVYFSISAERDPTSEGVIRIDHSRDHTKVHEDSHFLTLCIKGKDGYFRDMQMGMLGEGIAPIFELWFEGCRQSGNVIFTQESLDLINSGVSPIALSLAEHTASSEEFWNQAKAERLIWRQVLKRKSKKNA